MKQIKIMVYLSLAIVIIGCAKTYTLHDGLPSSQIAILKVNSHIHLAAIDGKEGDYPKPDALLSDLTWTRIELPPGSHTAKVGFSWTRASEAGTIGTSYSTEPVAIEFSVEPGHTYELRPYLSDEQWRPEVVEVH